MFEIGKTYNRRSDIHGAYSGQRQGGISTPANYPYVFLFTGDSGKKYGYKDEFRDDGIFWLTGEGQVGDMTMTSGNLAILDHEKNHKSLFLFEYVKQGHVKFIDEVKYVGHHTEDRLDKNQNYRKAIIFHLALIADVGDIHQVTEINSRLEKLRQKAILNSSVLLSKKELVRITANRAQAIKDYTLARANGICEGCNEPAPFKSRRGPFLEAHHVNRIADGGPDHPKHVIALCPNCHRRVHYGIDGSVYNNNLIEKLKTLES